MALFGKKKLLFLVILILFLSGCQKKEVSQGETTEIFSSYTISPAGALKDNGMHYLLFYDQETDAAVYLCNRAGCRHIDHTCGAFFEDLLRAFFYNGNLYAITYTQSGAQVFRANQYGENREWLADIPYPVLQMEIAGNELYFFGVIWEEQEKDVRSSAGQTVCRLNLDTGIFTEIPAIDTGYPNANPGHFKVTGDTIYISYTASDVNIADLFDPETGGLKSDISLDEIVYTGLVYRMDRSSLQETELICTREKTGGNFGVSVLEEHDDLLILFSPDRISAYNLLTKSETILYEPSEEMGMIAPLGDAYITYYHTDRRFVILKDWQETASIFSSDYGIDTYFGTIGNTAYFSGGENLYKTAYDQLLAGNYHFQAVDF